MKKSSDFWKLIFGESRKGMNTDANFQHEKDSIRHHESMKETLAQISQSNEQKRDSLRYITYKNLENLPTRPTDFAEQINFPSQESKIESLEFVRNAESVLKGIKFKNHKECKDVKSK